MHALEGSYLELSLFQIETLQNRGGGRTRASPPSLLPRSVPLIWRTFGSGLGTTVCKLCLLG